ncbi:SLOG family protein [Salinicoccus carnicancri]|uniref:SLOG family protein n=1 Tax=Salinicoccus carnicancri TaxID=558170 RepID=UPI0002E6ECCB|nr:SLOG family protein [Salinicoccus carnicancri]
MKTLIAGYRPYELGIFKDNDAKKEVLTDFLRHKIREYLESGTEWFIIQGYTGIELYAAKCILDLKEDYGVGLAVLKPFHDFDERYKDEEKIALKEILAACDFHRFIFEKPYENPGMFRQINRFLIENTDQAMIVYDEETPSKTRFLYNEILEFEADNTYNIERIQFDEINTFIDSRYDS